MEYGEKQLSKFLKFVFWFVAANSWLGALSLFLFADRTDTYFFWKIAPPINAMLMGAMYLVAGVVVVHAALRGTWESTRVVGVMGFSTGTLLFVVTLVHVDRFIPGFKLAYWLLVYFAFPVAIALLYRRYETEGANWGVMRQGIKPLTRFAALGTGFGLLCVSVIGLLSPALFASLGLWQVSDLMVRVFASWMFSLAASNLWFWVEKEWRRVQVVAIVLIATPLAVAVIMLINRADVTGNPSGMLAFGAALGLLALAGGFMLWHQRR